jgi:hypothetical protein
MESAVKIFVVSLLLLAGAAYFMTGKRPHRGDIDYGCGYSSFGRKCDSDYPWPDTKKEWDALPIGTRYMAPNRQIYTKRGPDFPTIQSDEDLDALPIGSLFIDPEGNERRKLKQIGQEPGAARPAVSAMLAALIWAVIFYALNSYDEKRHAAFADEHPFWAHYTNGRLSVPFVESENKRVNLALAIGGALTCFIGGGAAFGENGAFWITLCFIGACIMMGDRIKRNGYRLVVCGQVVKGYVATNDTLAFWRAKLHGCRPDQVQVFRDGAWRSLV